MPSSAAATCTSRCVSDTTDDNRGSFYDGHGHPFLSHMVKGVARTSRDGATVLPGLLEQAGQSPLRNGACRVHSQAPVDMPNQDNRSASTSSAVRP
jgi:hypothetical protein